MEIIDKRKGKMKKKKGEKKKGKSENQWALS